MGIIEKKAGKNKNAGLYQVFRISAQILIFVLLVVGTTFYLRPMQLAVQDRMLKLRNQLISRAEDFLGRTITYTSIGPSLFGNLDIRNIRICGDDGMPVGTIGNIRISYTFFTLIQGKILESVKLIRLDRPIAVLDKERDRDLLELFAPSAEKLKQHFSIAEFLPENIQLWIRNGELEIIDRANHFKLEGLTFDASLRRQRIQFQSKGNLGLTLTELLSQPASAHLSVQLAGECAADFQRGSANLNLRASAEDLFQLQPITINLTLSDNKIALKKINDSAAFDFSADYDMTADRLAGTFKCEGFSPKDSLTLTGLWEAYNQWLPLKTSGTVSFEKNQDQKFTYTVALAGNFPAGAGAASFGITGTGDPQAISFEEIAVHLAQGSIRYQGSLRFDPFVPEGVISVSELSFSNSDAVNAEIYIALQDKKIIFEGKEGKPLSFGDMSFSEVYGSAALEEQGLSFGASLSYSGKSIDFEGFFDYGASHYAEMNITLDSLEAPDLMSLIRPFKSLPELSGSGYMQLLNPVQHVSISANIYVITDFKHISYHTSHFAMLYQDQQDRQEFFTGVISGTEQYFQLNNGRIKWEDSDIPVTFQAEFADLQDISFTLSAAYLDKPYHLEGMILDRNSLSIQGTYGVRAYLGAADFGGYSGYFEADNVPIPWGQTGRLSLMSSLRYESPESWSFALDNFEITDMFTTFSANPIGTILRISGKADQQGAAFQNIIFDDGRGPLQGSITANWNSDFSAAAGRVTLSNEEGNEQYNLTGKFENKGLTVQLAGTDMHVGRFVKNSFNAVASGEVRIAWNSASSFSGNLKVASLTARVSDTEVSISGGASLDAEALQAEELSLHYGNLQLDIPLLTVNRAASRGGAEARFQIAAPSGDISASFALDIGFKPIASWLKVQEAADSFEGKLAVTDARVTTNTIEDFSLIFSRTDSLIAVSGGPQDMIRFQIADTGDFYAGLSNPSPVRGTVIGSIDVKGNTIDAQAQDLYVDLTALWRFVPSEAKNIININGGFVTASVQIAGPLGDPEFFGIAEGMSVRLGVPQFLLRDVRPIPITVKLEGKEMTFGPIPASVGTGQGTVAGWFQFDRWIPNIFELDINVPRESAIPFGFDILGIISYGKASGTLKLSMADMVFTAAGDLTADDTEITLNAEELAAASKQNQADLLQAEIPSVIDMTVRSGRKVEFMWPNAELPIIQASIEMGNSIKIGSDTLAHQYSAVGDVNIRGGEIFYFERNFFIRQGLLSLNENQDSFEPRLSARAEVRDQISSGPVTIAMIIDNAPLDNFTARFEATPALSQMEIISLLGQNLTGISAEGENRADPFALISSGTDILAQTTFFRYLQRGIRNIFPFLDMLTFRTQFVQNFVFLTVKKTIDDTIDKIGIGNYFDNTSVFIGKYVTSDMFVQGMLSLRYTETRIKNTVLQGLNLQGLILEPDFGIELRSPLFDIQLRAAFLHPENLFVNDVSVSVIRRRSGWFDMLKFWQ